MTLELLTQFPASNKAEAMYNGRGFNPNLVQNLRETSCFSPLFYYKKTLGHRRCLDDVSLDKTLHSQVIHLTQV